MIKKIKNVKFKTSTHVKFLTKMKEIGSLISLVEPSCAFALKKLLTKFTFIKTSGKPIFLLSDGKMPTVLPSPAATVSLLPKHSSQVFFFFLDRTLRSFLGNE